MNSSLHLALLQHACPTDASREANVQTAVAMARQAAADGAQLIVTQELFTSAYFPQVEDDARFDLAEPIPGPTTAALGAVAAELGVVIAASLFERRAAGVYHNTSVVIAPGSGAPHGDAGLSPVALPDGGAIVGMYRKMHIPDDPRFYEKYYFTPGDLGFQAVPLTGAGLPVTVGTLVCWDQWFPEAARLTAMQGAQVLLYPTAIGWYHGETPEDRAQQRAAWQTIQRSHAIANGVFVVAANRVGTEGELTFWGSSFVADPGGVVVAEASEADEQVLHAELDLGRIEALRRGWPFLRDRRIDAYGPLTRRLLD